MKRSEDKLTAYQLLSAFPAWVRTQSGEYDYDKPRQCALAQFFMANGFDDPLVGSTVFELDSIYSLPFDLLQALSTTPFTYEALAQRLGAEE